MKKLFIFILLIFIIIVNAYSSKFIEPFDPKMIHLFY